MRTLTAAVFVVGLASVAVGLALVLGSAAAAGDWWLARQPWIGLGLTMTVVGLLVVHVTAAPVAFLSLAPTAVRGLIALALLAAVVVAIMVVRDNPLVAAGFTFLVWVALAWILVARGQPGRIGALSAIAVPAVGLASLMAALWWLMVALGVTRSRVPGSEAPPRSLFDDAGTFMYSLPDLALLLPGVPTLLLIAVAVGCWSITRRRPAATRTTDEMSAVLT